MIRCVLRKHFEFEVSVVFLLPPFSLLCSFAQGGVTPKQAGSREPRQRRCVLLGAARATAAQEGACEAQLTQAGRAAQEGRYQATSSRARAAQLCGKLLGPALPNQLGSDQLQARGAQ